MNKTGRWLIRIPVFLLALLAALVAAALIAVNVSPRPFAWVVKRQFGTGVGIPLVEPALYKELAPQVRIRPNIEYPSAHTGNRLDLYHRQDASGPQPTILWVHGGGFVGGDKSGVATWATMVAGQGYTVVSINYALAPDTLYPGPVVQLGEAYRFLQDNAQRFPTVDLTRLIVGGDSAGAQIASEFVALQTNPGLGGTLPQVARVPPDHLLAAVLYCGPYDLVGLHDADKWFSRFLVRQIGWAYFGKRRWGDSIEAAQASSVGFTSSAWPATFITDGNSGSFEADARALEARLREQGVHVDALYYPPEHGRIGHEYQFDFTLAEAMESFQRTMGFLARITVGNQGP